MPRHRQPGADHGALFSPYRLYWSGVASEPVYELRRYVLRDSARRLVYLGPEVRAVAFDTGPSEQP